MTRDELVKAVAQGLFFLECPLFPPYKWEYATQRTQDLYMAKARFVWTYVDDADDDEEVYSGED